MALNVSGGIERVLTLELVGVTKRGALFIRNDGALNKLSETGEEAFARSLTGGPRPDASARAAPLAAEA